MKTKRDLSGIYFRFQDEKTGKWESRVFEDLPEKRQDDYMDDRSKEWLKSLAKKLADTLNNIGESFNLNVNETL